MKYVANQWFLTRGQLFRFICLLVDADGVAYNCYYEVSLGASEVEVKFQNQDGSILSKKRSLGQVILQEFGPPSILLCSLSPAETAALKKGMSTVGVCIYDPASSVKAYFSFLNAMSTVDPVIV